MVSHETLATTDLTRYESCCSLAALHPSGGVDGQPQTVCQRAFVRASGQRAADVQAAGGPVPWGSKHESLC